MEAAPDSDNSCSTFFSSSPISHGGDGTTVYQRFIDYLPAVYCLSTWYLRVHIFPPSIAQTCFSPSPISHGGEWLSMMIIYHAEAFLRRKEKHVFFPLSLFERKNVATYCACFRWEILRRVFGMKITPYYLPLLPRCFLGPKNHSGGKHLLQVSW